MPGTRKTNADISSALTLIRRSSRRKESDISDIASDTSKRSNSSSKASKASRGKAKATPKPKLKPKAKPPTPTKNKQKNSSPSPKPNESSSDSSSDSSDDEAIISAVNIASSAIKSAFSNPPLTKKKKEKKSNELTFLVPGYTAPMSLTSDYSSANLYINYEAPSTKKKQSSKGGATLSILSVDSTAASTVPSSKNLNTGSTHIMSEGIKKVKDVKDAGAGWFGMESVLMKSGESYQQSILAENLKKDQKIIRMRNYLDPKKFYKSSDTPSPFAQRGTVISSSSEYFSSRLTKKEQRSTLLDEVMADRGGRRYVKRKFGEIQRKKESGGKKWRKGMEGKRGKKGGGNIFSGSRKKFS